MDLKGLISRFVLLALATVVVGPLALVLWTGQPTIDGGVEATLLVGGGVASNFWRLVILVLAAGGLGMASARLIGMRWGMWNAGIVIAWVASSVTTDDLLRLTRDESVLMVLAFESGLVAVLGIGLVIAMTRVSRDRSVGAIRGSVVDIAPSMAGGLCACGAVVWVVAQEGVAGQVLLACVGGGLASGLVGCVIWSEIRPIWMVLSILLLGLGAILIRNLMGLEGLVETSLSGSMWPILAPVPLLWLAGAFLGVPIGMSWGCSLVESHQERESDGVVPTKSSLEA